VVLPQRVIVRDAGQRPRLRGQRFENPHGENVDAFEMFAARRREQRETAESADARGALEQTTPDS